MAAFSEHARIASMHPAVRRQGRRRRVGILVITDENAGAAIHDLAVRSDLQLDAGRGWAGSIRLHIIIRLQAAIRARFRLTVELLEIDAERAKEDEDVRPDRLTGRIGDADSAESQRIAQRPINEQVAQRIHRPIGDRYRLAFEYADAAAPRQAHE